MKQSTEQKKNVKAIIVSVVSIVVVFTLIIGLSYAWFFNRSNIATLVSIAPPSDIAIKGPEGQSLKLDLTYTDADKVGDKVTIHRVISIENDGSQHELEIAHTTNMKGLEFKLYQASSENSGNANDTVVDGQTYYYNQNSPIFGKYINALSVANDEGYGIANDTYHDKNYGEYQDVQTHVEPLYWVTDKLEADSSQKVGDDSEAIYRTYYILEISWTETTKETDIFYLLAKNA